MKIHTVLRFENGPCDLIGNFSSRKKAMKAIVKCADKEDATLSILGYDVFTAEKDDKHVAQYEIRTSKLK